VAGGFKESPLKLNSGLGKLGKWGEDEHKARAARLSATAVSVWTGPHLSKEVLAGYEVKSPSEISYSIDDHPCLARGAIRHLFDELRKAVVALDPCVTETFLKKYIAYKAETNFIDVIPQVNP
jgi:hypothetical protein